MLERIRRFWIQLQYGRPGSRFEEQFEKAHDSRKGPVGRIARIVLGLLLFPIGVFFLAVPGPGLLVIAFGAMLIAREFRFAAWFLDALELRVRPVWKWMQRVWRRLLRSGQGATR